MTRAWRIAWACPVIVLNLDTRGQKRAVSLGDTMNLDTGAHFDG